MNVQIGTRKPCTKTTAHGRLALALLNLKKRQTIESLELGYKSALAITGHAATFTGRTFGYARTTSRTNALCIWRIT